MAFLNDNTEFATKIHNLTLVRKRGILEEEIEDINAINSNILGIYNKGKQFYEEKANFDTSGFFRANQQYYIGLYINTKDCKHNPYLFIYDRINKKILDIIDYDSVITLKDKDKAFFIINSMDDSLQNNFQMVNKENISDMKEMAMRYDDEIDR